MRRLIFAINMTLDGCVDHTEQSPDDEVLAFFADLTRTADVQIFGRKTYELMVPYWPDVEKDPTSPKADLEFARAFNSIKKVVFSRSLADVDDPNTRVVKTGLREEIFKLKEESGKDLLVGGVEIPTQLVELGLIDEFLFVIMPVIAGQGRRLFDGISLHERLRLKLVDSKFFGSGTVALRYHSCSDEGS